MRKLGLGIFCCALVVPWVGGCGSDDSPAPAPVAGDDSGTDGGAGAAGSGGSDAGSDAAGSGGSDAGSDAAGSGGSDASAGVTPTCGAVTVSTQACADCADTNCCDLLGACEDEPDCGAYGDCVGACSSGDTTCFDGCSAEHVQGQALHASATACLSKSCATECGAGAELACGVANADADCNTCAIDKCCDDIYNYAKEPKYWVYQQCLNSCSPNDAACATACKADHPEGYAVWAVARVCTNKSCNAECSSPERACGASAVGSCNDCQMTACCAEAYGYAHNPDYWLYAACRDACTSTDTGCMSQCAIAHPDGYADILVWSNCVLASCNDTCAATPGTYLCGQTSWASGGTECESCIAASSCCEMFEAGGADPDYWRLRTCLLECQENQGGDASCYAACKQQFPQQATDEQMWSSCGATECYDECSGGVSIGKCGNLGNPDADCNACREANCCESITIAGNNEDYQAYRICQEGCNNDAQCLEDCGMAHLGGIAVRNFGTQCEYQQCQPECHPTSIYSCGMQYTDQQADCATCNETNCCAESTACTGDVECLKLAICVELQGCAGDTACIDACKTLVPGGITLFEAWDTCVATSCGTECPPLGTPAPQPGPQMPAAISALHAPAFDSENAAVIEPAATP